MEIRIWSEKQHIGSAVSSEGPVCRGTNTPSRAEGENEINWLEFKNPQKDLIIRTETNTVPK